MHEDKRPHGRFNNLPKQKNLRRHLRRGPTHAEQLLWQALRNRQLQSKKFTRQHGVGSYVVDFFCAEERLVIELDGDVHDHPNRARMDQERQMYLESLSLRVIRFRNEDVLENMQAVLEQIVTFLCETPTSNT